MPPPLKRIATKTLWCHPASSCLRLPLRLSACLPAFGRMPVCAGRLLFATGVCAARGEGSCERSDGERGCREGLHGHRS